MFGMAQLRRMMALRPDDVKKVEDHQLSEEEKTVATPAVMGKPTLPPPTDDEVFGPEVEDLEMPEEEEYTPEPNDIDTLKTRSTPEPDSFVRFREHLSGEPKREDHQPSTGRKIIGGLAAAFQAFGGNQSGADATIKEFRDKPYADAMADHSARGKAIEEEVNLDQEIQKEENTDDREARLRDMSEKQFERQMAAAKTAQDKNDAMMKLRERELELKEAAEARKDREGIARHEAAMARIDAMIEKQNKKDGEVKYTGSPIRMVDKQGNVKLVRMRDDQGEFAPPEGWTIEKEQGATENARRDTLEAIHSQIADLQKLYKPGYVGKVDSRLGAVGSALNLNSQEREDFLAAAKTLMAENLYLKSGKAINEAEYKRLRDILSDPNKSEKAFAAAVNRFKKHLELVMKYPGAPEKHIPDMDENGNEVAPATTPASDAAARLEYYRKKARGEQ